MIDIPDSWQQLHWKQQVTLAEGILAERGEAPPAKMEASAARAIIDFEARKRAGEGRAPAPVDPVVPDEAPKVPLKLNRDTWQGETRIRADGRVTQWSLDDAKRLIAIPGLADRADPLPGDA